MKEILTVLFRRKWQAIGFFAIAAGLPVLMSYVLPPRYEARATLLLTPGRYKKPFVPTERDSRTPFMQVSMEDVGSEVEILLSRPVLSEVVERTGLDRGCTYDAIRSKADLACAASRAFGAFLRGTGLKAEVPPQEAAIDRLRRKVSVEFVKRTNVIELTWRGSSPELARDVVNALVDAYLKHHLEVHGNTDALEALDRQAQEDGRRRAEAENRLSEFGTRNAISDIEAQHAEILNRLSEAESKVKVLRGLEGHDVSGDAVGALAGDPAFADLSRRLTDAEMRRVDVSTRFTPTASQVVLVNKEIAQLKTLIGERVTANLDKWQAMSETYRRELNVIDARKNESTRLKRDVEEAAERERLSRENLAEIQMSKGLDAAEVASVKVVERAAANRDPAFPKRLLILIVSVFLGLIGAPTWAVAVDRMSGKVVSVEDLEERLGLPVLASVPEYDRLVAGSEGRLAARL
ncbi:MAG TPA: Wzz/FepE/Etk N-terminal domain-containing protein, partial [Candidatus Polarisedimenticolia bacterium]|nr:Wzz/FepE/Etk N-terminal domain-containing protein [Candidatus Polarisedimenticolia bacterium]